MPADPFASYDGVADLIFDGTVDLDAQSFKLALFTSASNADSTSLDEYGDLTSEVANGNGYTTGGVALTSPTVTLTDTRDSVFTCANLTPAWTASGGSIVFRFFVVYIVGTLGGLTNPLVAFSLADNTPADVTIPNGVGRNVVFDATNGILRLNGTV